MMRVVPSKARNVMGSGNRESLDIINLILRVCMNWTMKTHIMYRCNLNSKQVQDYLDLILRFGLAESMEGESGRIFYRTTERGKKFIEIYAALLELFEVQQHEQERGLVPRGFPDTSP